MTKNYKGKLLSPPNINYKAKKNLALKVHTYFLSLMPSDISGFNVCPRANRITKKENHDLKSDCSSVCVAFNGNGRFKTVYNSRIKKTKRFFEDRESFLVDLVGDIFKAINYSTFYGYGPTFRLNAYSDIRWENIKIKAFGDCTIFELFPDVVFYDYSKIENRITPKNYQITYSHFGLWDITNEQIKNNYNVAMVFDKSQNLPKKYKGLNVVDGDKTDLRTAENDGVNTIVGLRAKMSKETIKNELKKHKSFVVRSK
tara:strand:- start:399 stop:1169 length:771 start_codon:yes stop_codon:yes gene_type:complete